MNQLFGYTSRSNILHESSDDYELPINVRQIPELREYLNEYNLINQLLLTYGINMSLEYDYKIQITNGINTSDTTLSPRETDKPLKLVLVFNYKAYTDNTSELYNEFGTLDISDIILNLLDREL